MKSKGLALVITLMTACGLWLAASRGLAGPAQEAAAGHVSPERGQRSEALLQQATTISSTSAHCMKIESDPNHPTRIDVKTDSVILIWDGMVQTAELRARICNSDPGRLHPIYLNGHLVGSTPVEGCPTCECEDSNGCRVAFPVDPSFLVSGVNRISGTNAANTYDTWKLFDARLYATGDFARAVTRVDFAVPSTSTLGAVQLPLDYDQGPALPLLLCMPDTAPGSVTWGGVETRHDALDRFALQAAQGWVLASMDMPIVSWPGTAPLIAKTPRLDVQQHVIGALNYVLEHYRVDTSRIYIAGFSAGGGMAATMAAKYPDVFAGVLDYAGPSNYAEWVSEHPDNASGWPWKGEFSGSPFEYTRRSSRALARNLRHVPMRMAHGTTDTVVRSTHSELLWLAMQSYFDPAAMSKEYFPHAMGHTYPVAGISETDLQFLGAHTLQANPQDLQIIADEGKWYYWLHVTKDGRADTAWQDFAEVNAHYYSTTNTIWVTKAQDNESPNRPLTLTLDLGKMGLNAILHYEIEDYDPGTGDFELLTAQPQNGKLSFAVPKNRLGGVQREFVLHPARGYPLETLRLQQGLGGYTGARDTYIVNPGAIQRGEQDVPHAGATALILRYDANRKGLLQFDLAPLQDIVNRGGVVKSAKLVVNLTEPKSLTLTVSANEMLRDWVDSQATWSWASTGQRWNADGASSPADIRASAEYTTAVRASGAYTFNLKSLVLRWLDNPSSNFGVALIGKGNNSGLTYPLASAEYADGSKRPALVIEYVLETPPAPTSTPTATETATPTQTPTATHTATSTATRTASASPTATQTGTNTPTSSPSTTPTDTGTPSATATVAPSATRTPIATRTPTPAWRVYLPMLVRGGGRE